MDLCQTGEGGREEEGEGRNGVGHETGGRDGVGRKREGGGMGSGKEGWEVGRRVGLGGEGKLKEKREEMDQCNFQQKWESALSVMITCVCVCVCAFVCLHAFLCVRVLVCTSLCAEGTSCL